MVRKVAKVGAVKTDRNWSRSERKLGVSCMCGLLVARDPGCCATPRIHPWPKEDAIPHAYSPLAKSAKPELRTARRGKSQARRGRAGLAYRSSRTGHRREGRAGL